VKQLKKEIDKFEFLYSNRERFKLLDDENLSVFGGVNEYFPLFEKCFMAKWAQKQYGAFGLKIDNYVMHFCPFFNATQFAVNVNDDTNEATISSSYSLGVWSGWKESSLKPTMSYSNGDQCWNGPKRSVEVIIICGINQGIIDVVENGKCHYEFTFETPAACSRSHLNDLKKNLKQNPNTDRK